MAKPFTTYRLAALALSFVLGTALPGVCHGTAGKAMSNDHDCPQEVCTAPCHLAKAPTETAPALLVETDRRPGGSGTFPAGEPPWVAPAGPLSLPRAAASFEGARAQQALPPVRLHVVHAVFLN